MGFRAGLFGLGKRSLEGDGEGEHGDRGALVGLAGLLLRILHPL